MGRRVKRRNVNLIFIIIISFSVVKLVDWSTTLSMFTWELILVGIIGLISYKKYAAQQRKLEEAERRKLEIKRQGNLDNLKKMNPRKFEHYISELFKQLKYDAHVTNPTGDGGKDIFVYKENFFGLVECKRLIKLKAIRPQIQKFHSAIIDCKADKGYFITTGEFTAQASSYILDKSIELIDGHRLIRLIEEITKEENEDKHFDGILEIV
ncbi:restriction endonuclease [Virgibacillus oceani]